MSFESSHGLDWFLSSYADLVVAYQWDPDDQLEFDILTRRYPLVHNNPRFKVLRALLPANAH